MSRRIAGNRSDADGLLRALLVISRTVHQTLESGATDQLGGRLSPSKIQSLRLLGQRGAQPATRIAGFLGVSKPAVSQLIDALARDGLVQRRRSKDDRRGVVLALTRRGQQRFRKLVNLQRHMIRSAVRLAPDGLAVRWAATLEQIAAALARADRAYRRYCLQCGSHADGSCVLVGGQAVCPFLGRSAPVRRKKAAGASRPIRPVRSRK